MSIGVKSNGQIVMRPSGGMWAKSTTYTTNFAATENPLSEGGVWTEGGTTGLDWKDCRSQSNKGFGTGASAGFDDNIAAIQGRFKTNKHFAQATVVLAAGYSPAVVPEIELHVGCTITAHNIETYEIDILLGSSTIQVAHWYGAVGSVDVLSHAADLTVVSGDLVWAPINNDVVRAEFDSTSGTPVITLFLNGTQKCVLHDVSGIQPTLNGSPGMGFFWRSDASIDATKWCFSSFTGGSL